MSVSSFKRLKWFCFVIPGLLVLTGCSETNSTDSIAMMNRATPEAPPSSYQFQAPMLLTAVDEPIRVEEPGYACPTLYDMDQDGAEDLIVGQFNSGKMKWYKNLSSPGETPKYGKGAWVSTDDSPAEVPGVS